MSATREEERKRGRKGQEGVSSVHECSCGLARACVCARGCNKVLNINNGSSRSGWRSLVNALHNLPYPFRP